MNPNQANRNKNSLLSCAVTGGFQDFTGSGIVLAAAGKLFGNRKKYKITNHIQVYFYCFLFVLYSFKN